MPEIMSKDDLEAHRIGNLKDLRGALNRVEVNYKALGLELPYEVAEPFAKLKVALARIPYDGPQK